MIAVGLYAVLWGKLKDDIEAASNQLMSKGPQAS
jgi:hypothetical protein